MLCSELTLVKHYTDSLYIKPLPCRRWSCEHCLPIRRRELIRQVLRGKPDTLITLTSSPETADCPEQAAKVLVDAWRKVRREACRQYGYKKLPFIAIFEATQAGWPHLHILARVKWIDQRWLSTRLDHHARAPIVDIRRAGSRRGVAQYVAKYVGKGPGQFGTLKRYWAAQCFDKRTAEEKQAEKDRKGIYSVTMRRFDDFIEDFEWMGWTAIRDGDGAWLRAPGTGPPC